MTTKDPADKDKAASDEEAKANEALEKEMKEQLARSKKIIDESAELVKQRLHPRLHPKQLP